MAASVDTLEAELAAAMIAIAFLAKKAGVDTTELQAFAASAVGGLPEARKTAILQTLSRLVAAYKAAA